jgi:hypothetical protein
MEVNGSSAAVLTDPPADKKNKPAKKEQETARADSLKKNDQVNLNIKKDNIGNKDVFAADKKPKTIFKTDEEKGAAEKYLDRFSNNAFDHNRTVEDRFLLLKPVNDTAMKGNISMITTDPAIGGVRLSDMKDVHSLEDIANAAEKSLSTNYKVRNALGPNPTKEQLDEYIKKNLNSIATDLGDKIPYEGFTSFVGDIDGMKALNDGYGVCTDIHAAVTSFRKSFGQEAYIVMTTGSDAAHVFTIFKEDGKWNIQNYGNVYQTDARTIAELYDQAMPEQRKIKIYDVAADGTITQKTTDHLTATGLAERRFRAEAGTGNFNPWTTEDGLNIGTNEISFAKNGAYLGINPTDNTVRAAYYKKTEEGDTRKIQGGSIEGQYFTNPNGYDRKHIEAKYDIEKKYDNAEKQIYGRSHFSVFAGVEATPTPLYWSDISDGSTTVATNDPAVHAGVSYSRNDSKLYGSGPLKFELGHQTNLRGVLTFSGEDPLSYDYVGRMYSDAVAESKLVTGAFYQPTRDLTIRTGLASGVDLAKIDGVKDPVEQLKNIAESDAYLDISFAKGPVAVNALGIVPLNNPTQYKVGAGLAFVPTKSIAIGATYIHEQIVNDKIDSLRVGAEFRPTDSVAIGASVSTPVIGDNAKNIRSEGYLKVKF